MPGAASGCFPMTGGEELLTPKDAAHLLGVATTTLYDWLGRSRRGLFVLRGTPVTIAFFQTGSQGQGHIRIEVGEVRRLRELMRVPVETRPVRRPPIPRDKFPGINVPLGRPA